MQALAFMHACNVPSTTARRTASHLSNGRQHHEMLPAAYTMPRKPSGRSSKEMDIVFAFDTPESIIQSQLAGMREFWRFWLIGLRQNADGGLR